MATGTLKPVKSRLRNKIGIKSEDWCQPESVWSQEALLQSESAFMISQYIQYLIRKDPSNVAKIVSLPQETGFDVDVWQYEHLRQFCIELNHLISLITQDNDCSPQSCSSMKAADYLYLCAAHPSPNECVAIDYIVHTLDHTVSVLNNSKFFPSRISISESSAKHISSMARRLYRIFAHTWFHHREIFHQFENETHLYARFLYFGNVAFELLNEQTIVIPSSESFLPHSVSISKDRYWMEEGNQTVIETHVGELENDDSDHDTDDDED